MTNNYLESLKKNYKGIIFIFIASLLTSVGQLFWKMSHNYIFLGIGFVCYGLGAVLMIVAFKFGSFSVLHPMMCLSYVFALIFGSAFLQESIGVFKILGVISIITGVVLIGGGDH